MTILPKRKFVKQKLKIIKLIKKVKNILKKIIGQETIFFIRRQLYIAKLKYQFFESYEVRVNYLKLKKTKFTTTDLTCDRINRQKPHILFVTEKWCDCNPDLGTTNSEHNLFGSLEASGLATHDRFHFDEYFHKNKQPGDRALISKCLESQPDLLILTWMQFLPYNPSLETIEIISQDLKIPIVLILFDSVTEIVTDVAELLLPLVKLNIVLDSTTACFKKTRFPEKYLPLWTPQDSRIFNNSNLFRDIPISFLGSLGHEKAYQNRRAGLAALKSAGVEIYHSGGKRENPLSVEKYAEVFQKSKISLNFSRFATSTEDQFKGRTLETTLCGAMLLESENSQTAKWLEPMVDYVPFTDTRDLVEKAKHYLQHDSEREKIAANGHQKAMQKYTGELFWKTILDKLLAPGETETRP